MSNISVKMKDVAYMRKEIRSAFALSYMLLLTGCTPGEFKFFSLAIFLFFVGVVIWGIVEKSYNSKQRKGMEYAARKNMVSSQKGVSTYSNISTLIDVKGRGGIAVDTRNKKVGIVTGAGQLARTVMFSYRDVLSSEIIEDGESVTKTARGSQIGGALIGGLALGGVGAIIGGLSGATKSAEKVSKIALMVTVNDMHSPVHYVMLLDDGISYKKSHSAYQKAMGEAKVWHGKIQVLIRQADEEDKLQEQQDAKNTVAVTPQPSLTDELEKLGELRDKGILTEEEFISQKAKLLAK